MDDNKVTLYITYKDGYAEVEIEEDGVRRKYGTKYGNAENKEPREFCAWVANMVEGELGVPVEWSLVDKNDQKKPKKDSLRTALKVGGVVIVSTLAILGVLFVGLVAYSMVNPPNNGSNASATQTDTTKKSDKSNIDQFTKVDIPEDTSANSSDNLTAEQKKLLAELKLVQPTEVHFESNSSYTVCAGTVTNRSDKYYRFIQVKGEFMDEGGNTIDTAWTYACGDEGLGPGESSKFTMSVARDSRITNVRCYTYDFV